MLISLGKWEIEMRGRDSVAGMRERHRKRIVMAVIARGRSRIGDLNLGLDFGVA